MFIGNVRTIKTGFKKAFIIPSTRAVIKAEVKFAKWIPGSK